MILLFIAGLVAGYIDSIAGGGGMISIPALLLSGLPPHAALGTNKFSASLGITNAARIYIRKKIFKPLYWKAAMVATVIGAMLGALAVHLLSNEALQDYIPIILMVLVVYMLWPKKPIIKPRTEAFKPPATSSSIAGVFLGAYDGFLGPGAGSFWAGILTALYRMDLVTATAVAKLMNCLSNISGLLVFLFFGDVDFTLGIIMGGGMIIGAHFGSHSAIRFGSKFIRPVLVTVVLTLAAALAWQHWFN